MKVLYAIAAFLGRGIGWTAQNAITQARAHGAEVAAFTLDDAPDLLKSSFKDYFFSTRLSKVLREVKPDILHVWNNMGYEAILVAQEMGIKVVVERASTYPTWQDEVLRSEYGDGPVMDPFDKIRMISELSMADMVFVPSEFAAATYPPNVKVRMLPFGVDCEHFKPNPIEHDEYRVLFAGDNVLRKGIKYLFEAWQIVDSPYWELWVKANAYVPQRYGKLNNIKVINEVPDMADLYNQVDVFCLPSIEEGQALVVWEAMACGLPCVVTRETGSLIQNGIHGVIIPAKSSKAIYHALQDLVVAPLKRDSLGKKARWLAEQYPWERYGKSLYSAYEELLK